jgi:hypothetical protein
MLNTVLLFTPPNHGIAASATCGHLRPIVGIIWHNIWHNMTFWTPPFPVLHRVEILVHKMSDVNLEQIFFVHPKKHFKWKIPICNSLILKSLKTRFWSTANSATEWSEQKSFWPKFSPSKTVLDLKFKTHRTFLSGADFLLGRPRHVKTFWGKKNVWNWFLQYNFVSE